MAPTLNPIPTRRTQKRVRFNLPNSLQTSNASAFSSSILPSSATQRLITKASVYHQIEYRSYQHDIKIYHSDTSTIPSIRRFKYLLRSEAHGPYGFTDMRSGEDTLRGLFIPDGDEVPRGKIEVGYLPNIFPAGGFGRGRTKDISGSALGFRDGGQIAWLCFKGPIEDTLLATWCWDPGAQSVVIVQPGMPQAGRTLSKIFDHVATMPKGITQRRVKGANEEHKKWHDSLWRAPQGTAKQTNLRVTYKGLGRDIKAAHGEMKRNRIRLEERQKWSLGESVFDRDMDIDTGDAEWICKRTNEEPRPSRLQTVAEWTESRQTTSGVNIRD